MDEEADGGVVTAVATENATSVTLDDTSAERFEIADGNLKLKEGTTLDFETDDSPIEVTITASGDGDSATHTVTVSITDVNEAPTISVADGTTPDGMDAVSTVEENVTGALLGEITLGDPDSGQTHTLSTSDPKFVTKQDDAGGWWLALADDASLSYEDGAEVTVTVTVTDDGDPAMSTSVDVMITVTDVNEVPAIEVADGETPDGMPASSTVDEENAGAILGAITLSDPDMGQTHTLEVTGDDRVVAKQDDAGGWWLALADGESFDYETDGDSIDVTVTVTDDGDPAMSASADVTITITPVNEAPEVAEDGMVDDAVFAGGEENSNTVDLKALFSDPDGDTLTYRLSDNAPDWMTFSVTTSGSGEDQTIMGTISGTPPADMTDSIDGVSIIAMDADGMSAEVTFDIVVDAENAAPSRLDLRVTEDDGVVVRVTAVEVDENAKGAVLGTVRVHDDDDARHPHGQHDFSFEVDGEADDRFEVKDGQLKLMDDASLNFEAGDEITLKITATDRQVTASAEDEDPTNASVSQSIKITVKDIAAGDGPVALKTIGDWWVTVDDDLDAEDVRDGDWLSFSLDTTGDDAAFTDEDGDDLTYSVTVEDADGTVVDWLQISDSGKITNKADMLPERGVYTVTVTATDEGDNSARTSFTLAVALSDEDDRDNDRPDIRDVEEYEYVEGSGSQKVASFSVRDDDVAIAPHPYGQLKVTLSGAKANRFKVMEVGRDEDSVHYEIHTKSAAELAVDDDGEERTVPLSPLDHEEGDDVDIVVSVTDAPGYANVESRTDTKTITIDIEDAADEAPRFAHGTIADDEEDARWSVSRKTDLMTKAGTTTIEVDQEQDKVVIVVQLFEVWSDPDTDVDELDFSVGGRGSLPDWMSVYGPDEWEEIYDRRGDVNSGDGPSGVRDGDHVVVIVLDRSAADGENVSLSGASFTITAEDDEGNSTTETIAIGVDDTNVGITPDPKNPVVEIVGDPEGIAPLTIDFDAAQDPDIAGGEHPVLVVYTWSTLTDDDNDPATDPVVAVVAVSSTADPLPLDANMDRVNDYAANENVKIMATVQYYEVDPETGAISVSQEYSDTTDTIETRDPVPEATGVSFDLVTATGGVAATISATGEAAEAGTARLEVSTDGTSGWITVDTGAADTSTAATTVTLEVDADANDTAGDGGGLYYRVVYVYEDEDGDSQTATSDVIQLGDVADPISGATTNILSATTPTAGETIRIDNQSNDVEVQWQMLSSRPNSQWTDIEGATGLELEVADAHAGNMLRAKVTYTADDDPATTDVDEEGWPVWVEYTEVLTVSGATTNTDPAATQANHVFRVELDQKSSAAGAVQNTAMATFDASSLFFDADGDDLTYTITAVTPDVPGVGSEYDGGLEDGGSVYRTETVVAANPGATPPTLEMRDFQQSFSIDKDTGMVTYITDREQDHDGTGTDGTGNTLTFTISASDGATGGTAATATVMVRVNVTPTAIELDDGTATAANLPAPGKDVTGTALTDTNGNVSYTDDAENTGAAVATIDVMDQNLSSDKFGMHEVTLSGRGADQFEVVADSTPADGSTWEIRLKDDAVFDFEALRTAKEKTDGATSIELSITVTATDGGGLVTKGVFKVTLVDADTDDDPEAPTTPTTPDAPEPETPGLEDDADDSDNDGPVIPPDDGGMFLDDLLDEFVITIDDIDVA